MDVIEQLEAPTETLLRHVRLALARAGALREAEAGELILQPVSRSTHYDKGLEPRRFHAFFRERPLASVKQVPLRRPFDADAILAVYREYARAKGFRPVRLMSEARESGMLTLVEEYVDTQRTLDRLVQESSMSGDEATARIQQIVDEIWELGEPCDSDLLERELADLGGALREVIEDGRLAGMLFDAICEIFRQARSNLRTTVSTRDYIGRNIVLGPDNRCILLDYDLAARTSLFALGVARGRLHDENLTDSLYRARGFSELNPSLMRIAVVAAEYSLLKRLSAPALHDGLLGRCRQWVLEVISPIRMASLDRDVGAARTFQSNMETDAAKTHAQLEAQRSRSAELEARVTDLLRPQIDIMVVAYNSARWIDGFMASVKAIQYPAERLRLVFVDNGSRDGTIDRLQAAAVDLRIEMEVIPTGKNLGFTGGYREAFRRGEAKYYFVVNLDTVISPDVIGLLVDALEKDASAGIAEARQAPNEHPKYYDPFTGETSWCSGACMLVRAKALEDVGGGFEDAFFMYAEDVDLSWRMWLNGWRCLYVPEAVVQHFTEQLDPQRDQSWQHYFSMRNGALMHVMYSSWPDVVIHYLAMLHVALFSRNPRRHRWLTFKAIITSLSCLPTALRGRKLRRPRMPHPWVFFDGWLYGRHQRDLALRSDEQRSCLLDLTAVPQRAAGRIGRGLPVEGHIAHRPHVQIGANSRAAILVFDTAEVDYRVFVPPGARLTGWIAAPPDTWRDGAVGRFDVLQDGAVVKTTHLHLGRMEHRRWVPFEAPLASSGAARTSCLTLRFRGETDLGWGLWGDVRICGPDSPERGLSSESLSGVVVSVVIPTHNRADGVGRVISRLMAQDLPPEHFEVIVVDSNSQDRTPEALADLCARFPRLTALRCEKPGAASARNMGIERTSSPLVLLMDDDILVGRDFLRRMLQAHVQNPDRVLLGRIVAPWEGTVDPFHRYLLQAQDVNVYDFKDDMDVPANYFYTACVGIPRRVLQSTRFDEGFQVYGVEDIEFGFRLLQSDVKMIFLRDVEVGHEYYPLYRPFRAKKLKAGYSLGYFLRQHPEHAHRFVFEPRFQKWPRLLRLACRLSAPLAGLAYLRERIRYTDTPLHRRLFRWFYHDLRSTMYAGMMRFRRGAPPP